MDQPTPDDLINRVTTALSRTVGFISASVRSRDPVIIAVAFTDRNEAHRYWETQEVNAGRDTPRASIDSGDDTTVLLEWPKPEVSVVAKTVPPEQRTKAKSGFFSKAAWWPTITNRETAQKVARNEVWAAIFVAAVDAVIFCLLAIGIHKMFRTAAVAAFGLFVVEKILWFAAAVSHSQNSPDTAVTIGPILVTLAITAAFLNSVRATFAYHKLPTP